MRNPEYSQDLDLLISDDLLLLHWNMDFEKHKDDVWIHGLELNIFNLDTKCHVENVDDNLDTFNCQQTRWGPWYNEIFISNAKQLLEELKQSKNKVHNGCYKTLHNKLGGPNRLAYRFRIADVFLYPIQGKRPLFVAQ